MTLKDLTKEQIIEIVNLVYPFPDWIRGEIKIKYQPFDEKWLEDAAEYWFINFEAISFGDKIDTFRLWIYPNLNLEFDAIRKNPENMTEKQKEEIKNGIVFLGSIPIRNQHLIHKKFIEWNIEPSFK